MKMDDHTWVVCAYKESKYLEECIESILNQTVKSNVIISTSTPNDHIKKLAKKYKIKLVINKGEKGIGQDWNYGVSQTETKYVTVAHQDDVYNENYLEEIKKYIDRKNGFIIAFTDYREIKNGGVLPLTTNLKIKKMMLKLVKFFSKSRFMRKLSIAFGNSICCPSVTLNTEILGKTPYVIEMKSNLDWDSWLEFSKHKGRFAYINKELMCHRIHEESETSNLIGNNVRLEEDYEMFCKFWPKPIAKLLMRKYKNAIKTNQV